MKWINVKKQLPDSCEEVLVAGWHNEDKDYYIEIASYDNGWQFDYDEVGWKASLDITHWAFLPDPPMRKE